MSDNQYTETIGIRVTEDTEKAIEDYASQNGLNKSSAARELLREGMWEKRISPYTKSAGQRAGLLRTVVAVGLAGLLGYLLATVI